MVRVRVTVTVFRRTRARTRFQGWCGELLRHTTKG